jgi:uroporphyrinogen-III decarboxylase
VDLQGDFDPEVLYSANKGLEKKVERVRERWKGAGGSWIANSGYGITPNVNPEMTGWFLECVHKYPKR